MFTPHTHARTQAHAGAGLFDEGLVALAGGKENGKTRQEHDSKSGPGWR